MDDETLVRQFVAGDRDAFRTLVERYQPTLLSIARYYAGAQAEDVAQDTWMAVVRGAERFEGRSSFKTWLFTICANRGRATGVREHRTVSLDPTDPVASDRFNADGMWREPPEPFTDLVARRVDNEAVLAVVQAAIRSLPHVAASVVTLRDVEGLRTREVADVLGLSEGNVRVVLHRARADIRSALESWRKEGS